MGVVRRKYDHVNFLNTESAKHSLASGKTIEAWLFYGDIDDIKTIRFCTLSSNDNALKLIIWECEDIGDDEFIDIYSFPDAEPDYEPIIYEFEYYDDAFEKITELGGDLNKLCHQFDLQWYYKSVRVSA